MKTHPLNVSYLVIGLVFLGISGSWALRQSGVVELGEIRWLLPLTLVAAGLIGLVAFAAKGLGNRDDGDAVHDRPYDDAPTTNIQNLDDEGDLR
jgi:hypothetical protein